MIDFVEVWRVFLQTFQQALASSLLSLVGGFFIALGLINIKSARRLSFIEWFFISPQILPALFILLSAYQLYAVFDSAPAGFWDVVIIHVFINAGFSGVQISRVLKTKIGGFAELAQVEGAGAGLFFKTVLPYLRRDLLQIFFTVFVFCFLSFSVPVVVGGKGSETLEVLIYKLILTGSGLNSAILISVIQFVLMATVGAAIGLSAGAGARLQNYRSVRYGSRWFLVIPFAAIALLYFFTFKDVFDGFIEIFKQPSVMDAILKASWGTLVSAVTAGGVVFILTALLAFMWPQVQFSRLLFVVTPPSFVFVGLLLFVVGWSPKADWIAFALLGLCLAVLFFFSLYRFGIASVLEGITHQVNVANTLGASRAQIFMRITLPQLVEHFSYFAGIAAFWAAGDFALSLFTVPVESNLALFVKMLISRYKLEMGTAVMWWMMVLGFIVFLFFKGVGRVVHRKIN